MKNNPDALKSITTIGCALSFSILVIGLAIIFLFWVGQKILG